MPKEKRAASWPPGEGEMARHIRAFDWTATPLGPIETWPQYLRTAVDIVLGSGHAMQLAWGRERTMIYNDAYAPMLGERHPAALGIPFREAWPEIWDEIAPLVARVFAGESLRFEAMPLLMTRHGYPESTWWNFSYSPIRDEEGRVAGLLNVTADATGRICAERERDKAVRLQSALLDVLPVGLALTDTEGRVILSNPEWERFVPNKRLLSHDSTSASRRRGWTNDGEPIAPEHFPGARALRGERCIPGIDFLHTDRAGAAIWTNASAVPLRDADGEIVGAVSIIMDVDAETRAKDALRQSEARFRALATAGAISVYRMSADWHLLYQLESSDFLSPVNEPIADWRERYILAEDRDELEAAIGEAIRTRSKFELEHRVRMADGKIGWVLARAIPIFGCDGEITEWLGTGSNITRRKVAEEQLREREAQFRQFADAAPGVLWIRDVDSLQTIFSSRASAAIYGYDGTVSDRSLRFWLRMILPEDRKRVLDNIRRIRAGDLVEHEFRIRRADTGDLRWIQNVDFPLVDSTGNVWALAGIGMDVTAAKQANERQQMLVAELQHRTRNLMTIVHALADRIGRASTDLADFRARFGDWLNALARIHGLLSRLESGSRITFDELIRAELDAMSADMARTTLSGPGNVRLRSSTVQTLALALHELATNAVKYGALGQVPGRLAITWSLELKATGSPWLHIDWRESGVVMPPGLPNGAGKGRDLITEALPYQLGARTSHVLTPDGVHCTISIPVSASTLQAVAPS